MNRLPMARHIQQYIHLNNDTLFQLTAFRNPTIPFTLTLTVGHASNHKVIDIDTTCHVYPICGYLFMRSIYSIYSILRWVQNWPEHRT
jgi:hypothetical protein